MKAITVDHVITAFRTKPNIKQYDDNVVIMLVPSSSRSTDDFHLFDLFSSLDLTDKRSVEDAFSVLGFDFGIIIISKKQVS
jgi:hypothetical protein